MFELEVFEPEEGLERVNELSTRLADAYRKFRKGQRWSTFVGDIEYHVFWHVLNFIDGSFIKDRGDRISAQSEARECFDSEQTQELFTFAVNAALYTDKTGKPGYEKGKTILFERVADDSGSRFSRVITPEFRKILVNGVFWENLIGFNWYSHSEMYRVENVLLRNFSDLSIAFAPAGLANMKKRTMGPIDLVFGNVGIGDQDEEMISEVAVEQFFRFMTELDAHRTDLGISRDDMKMLMKPYIEAVDARDEFGYFMKGAEKKREYPLVQKYRDAA